MSYPVFLNKRVLKNRFLVGLKLDVKWLTLLRDAKRLLPLSVSSLAKPTADTYSRPRKDTVAAQMQTFADRSRRNVRGSHAIDPKPLIPITFSYSLCAAGCTCARWLLCLTLS